MMNQNNESKLANAPTTYEVHGEEVTLTGNSVRNFLARGNGQITDQEVVMFISLCKFQKLNPFLNEAYLVKFGNKDAQIIVSKEAFMKRAEAHPEYNGMMAGIIVERDNEMVEIEGAIKLESDKLIGGWAHIFRKDRKFPIIVKIALSEFSKGQATWNAMPMNMIRKTAIVNAMREAFPDHLGAMYTEEEELPSIPPRNVEAEVEENIQENANKELIDFDDAEEEVIPASQKLKVDSDPAEETKEEPRVIEDVVEEDPSINEEESQGALFKNLKDLEDEAPAF